ncbi:TPM domain-containing protein [Aquimarina mytili]|uniref:TPM domain-containing protein n=1 Tax=Aquimarina mytili TaxID=874423 RepID=A0A936ZVH7_9FLAO|nr:TPM domain-containing protein [Aquimarina mytili]MBL0686147.1 TPM domain-containing protein [Aquimarina mytili]
MTEYNSKSVECQNLDFGKIIESKFVYDYESILSIRERKNLEETISKFRHDTGNEILIVTTHSIGRFPDFRSYAMSLGDIYSQEVKNDNIIIIVISKILKKVEITTSDKSKETLTDDFCKIVIYESFLPEFKKGNFYNGIEKGLAEIITKWK